MASPILYVSVLPRLNRRPHHSRRRLKSVSAVSVCPPAYYADLVCERGRNYLYKIYVPDNIDAIKKVKFDRQKMEWDWKHGVHKDLADSMWYI